MKNKGTILGLFLIVAGLGIMAWAFLPTFFTGLESDNKQDQAVESLEQSWSSNLVSTDENVEREKGDTETTGDTEDSVMEGIVPGDAFAVVKIPAFGDDWAVPVAEGTTADILDRVGAGHYPQTEGPGEVGNFALAGHNAYGTYGAFQRINELQPGNEIIVETKDKRYIYVFESSEIVLPDAGEVLYPVPHEPDTKPTKALLTMTTCWPAWSDEERWISYSVLDRVEDK